MKSRRVAIFATLLAVLTGAALLGAYALVSDDLVVRGALRSDFVALRLPAASTRELFDIGVADANGDDYLDVYSANHNTRQILWVADGRGNFMDMLSSWGLDQDPAHPGAEISDDTPEIAEPGVYIYWESRNQHSEFPLVFRTHRLKDIGRLEGSLQSYSALREYEAGVFTLRPPIVETEHDGKMPRTTLRFAADRDGVMKVIVASPGVPVTVSVGESIPLANVYVGRQKVNPKAPQISSSEAKALTQNFVLAFQDRHGMAWSDFNGDGLLDVFISRGAIGGTLRKFPPSFQARIQDELMVSRPDGRYLDMRSSSGIEKRGCSGRKVTWVDFDRDGLLDLFVNCMERGFIEGNYPKQFYRQTAEGKFTDVAEEVGLALADHEIIDFAWFDVDDDGYPDLVTYEANGFFLYRNGAGRKFTELFIGRGKFVRADRPQLRGTSDEYWFVDGKLAVADFNGDGKLDIFSASKVGNVLLVNNGRGGFSLADPPGRGLPGASATAQWVDFDNDGLIDLFASPQGLFRQTAAHGFESTGLLAMPERKYMAAIANWADLDNDGRRDLVIALLENFSFWTWWEKLYKTNADRFLWRLAGYKNVSGSNHWLQLRLVGNAGNPQAIGARVTASTAAGRQTQIVGLNDGAFFSQGHYRLYFGLGSSTRVDSLQILWPDGHEQLLSDLEADRLHVIRHVTDERQEVRQ